MLEERSLKVSGGTDRPPFPSHYETLQVHPTAPVELISAAYWRLVGQVQAARSEQAVAAADSALYHLNKAYQVLADAAAREAYDDLIRLAPQSPVPQVPRGRHGRSARFKRFWPFARKAARSAIDYYEVLRVNRSAPPFVIDQAYAIMRRNYLRLVTEGRSGAELLELLEEAYAVISDPKRRAEYNAPSGDRDNGLLEPIFVDRLVEAFRRSRQSGSHLASALAAQAYGRVRELVHTGAATRLLAVAAVLTLAAGLRLLELNRIGFNSDEAVYAGQAGALTGDSAMGQFFSVFRAHPLLFQLSLGGLFSVVGISDLAARLFVSLFFGVGSIALTYLLASRLYGHRLGLAASSLMAVLPYHVLVSRQVLLDSPLTFFVLLTMLFTARGIDDRSGRWMIWAGLSAGLATATKETGVLLFPVIGLFILASGAWRQLSIGRLTQGLVLFAVLVAPYPISRMLAPQNGSSYLLWQISRPPNHEVEYFLRVLMDFGSIAFVALALLGLIRLLATYKQKGNALILLWIAIFVSFFQIFPTKLFPYLMPVIPALCICAVIGLDTCARWIGRALSARRRWRQPLTQTSFALMLIPIAVYLGVASLSMVRNGSVALGQPLQFDVEVQDFAGGREVGLWAREHTPADARFLTIGPSVGNIIRFYGHRDSVALSVSPNPLYRNPAYVPVPNPDLWFRENGLHYIVWDFYSADRSAFYNARLNRYVRKFGGNVVYSVYEEPGGNLAVAAGEPPRGAVPLIIVYDAIGGDPPGAIEPAAESSIQ